MNYFINLSNHPSQKWCQKQLEKAAEFGEIIDLPFPNISPFCSDLEMNRTVDMYLKKIMEYDRPTVMLQGEYIFTYRLLCRLKQVGIKVVASCNERVTQEYTVENGNTVKKSEFEFIGFREY